MIDGVGACVLDECVRTSSCCAWTVRAWEECVGATKTQARARARACAHTHMHTRRTATELCSGGSTHCLAPNLTEQLSSRHSLAWSCSIAQVRRHVLQPPRTPVVHLEQCTRKSCGGVWVWVWAWV